MRDRLPSNFPSDLLPAGAQVKLVAVSPTRTTVVALAAGLTAYQIPSLQTDLYRNGWLTRRPGRSFAPDASMPFGRPDDYCRGEDTATVSFQFLSNAAAVRASHARAPGRPCLNTPGQTGAFDDVPMPLLVPPARMSRGGGGGGLNVFDSTTRVHSSMTASDISKDFANQLGLGGWKVAQRADVGARAAVLRAHHVAAAGDPVTALVTTTSLMGTARVDLWLHVVRHKPVTPQRGGLLPATPSARDERDGRPGEQTTCSGPAWRRPDSRRHRSPASARKASTWVQVSSAASTTSRRFSRAPKGSVTGDSHRRESSDLRGEPVCGRTRARKNLAG